MAIVNPGYMGYAIFAGAKTRFTDCSVAAKQEINAPDLVTGHWNRQAFNYGPVDISGTLSGPVGELFSAGATSMWSLATTRDGCGALTPGELTINYYCNAGVSYTYTTAKVNSVTFSCAAGDVAQFSMDMIAAEAATVGGYGGIYDDPEKLVTWDKVGVAVTASDGQTWGSELFSNFEVTFGNNVEAVYALGQPNLYPYALVDGLTTITGSVSVYNIPTGMKGADSWDLYSASPTGTITFSVGGADISLNVKWHRVEPAGGVGPMISTVAFTGVTTQP